MNPIEEPRANREADKAFYRAILHEMINTGISLIRTLEFNTVAHVTEGEAPPPDAALSYERLTRAVRRTIMLAEKLAEPQANTPTQPESTTKSTTPPHEILDHDRPERPGGKAPHSNAPNPSECENPTSRPNRDTLDRPDDLTEEAPDNRPIPEQIAALRRELGLPPIPTAAPPAAQPTPPAAQPTPPAAQPNPPTAPAFPHAEPPPPPPHPPPKPR